MPITILFLLLSLVSTLTAEDPLTYQQILKDRYTVSNAPTRNFNNLLTLAFVTPWNADGHQAAIDETERGRLDVVSTVSWQMQPDGLKGGHDFDSHYNKQISEAGGRHYPRLLFETSSWTPDAFSKLADNPGEMIDLIVQLCKTEAYEGIVLEIWQAIIFSGAMKQHGDRMVTMLIRMGEEIRKKDLHTVLVFLPYGKAYEDHGVTADNLQRLSIGFSYFLVMTYDYSLPGTDRPGPIAPVPWVKQVAEFFSSCEVGAKTLLGLNFYGVDFRIGNTQKDRHVVGHEIASLLDTHHPSIEWLEEHGEHKFSYEENGRHQVYFPTRQSIRERLQIAKDIGLGGVAIWEIGQGLPHFFEEF